MGNHLSQRSFFVAFPKVSQQTNFMFIIWLQTNFEFFMAAAIGGPSHNSCVLEAVTESFGAIA